MHSTYAGWAPPVPLTVPSTQSVTFVLDADALRLLVNSEYFPLTTDGRAFLMKGEFTLWRAASESWVTYDDVSLTVNGDHLVGTAHVRTMDITFQAASDVDLGNATFVGGPDTTSPIFFAAPFDPVTHPFQTVALSPYVDPFDALRLSAGEPLPPPDLVQLRSDSGDTLTLRPDFLVDATVPHETTAMSGPGAMSFFTPYVLLRYAAHYRLVVDGITDFAGNAAVGLEFDTPRSRPSCRRTGSNRRLPPMVLRALKSSTGPAFRSSPGARVFMVRTSPSTLRSAFLAKCTARPSRCAWRCRLGPRWFGSRIARSAVTLAVPRTTAPQWVSRGSHRQQDRHRHRRALRRRQEDRLAQWDHGVRRPSRHGRSRASPRSRRRGCVHPRSFHRRLRSIPTLLG